MSVFDEVELDSSYNEETFGPQEGFAGVLLGASACDGHIADEEVQSLMTTVSRMKLYSRLPGHKFSNMMDRLTRILKKGGPEMILDKCAPAVPPELRQTVFANAIDIVLADGVVDDDEKEFIDNLQSRLEIEGDIAKRIVKVMIMKNKG